MLTPEAKARIEKVKFYCEVLKSNECQCGMEKQPGRALCYRRCWKRLPNAMQRALYKSIGAGFEEAYEDAVKFLS